MNEVQRQIRDAARDLLAEKKVQMIIGFEDGTVPLRSRPAFIRDEDDVDRLTWNSFCENNLANYLRQFREMIDAGQTIGVVAKGCDVRSLICLLQEGQVRREQLVIIGVPCRGMVDRKKLERDLPGEVREAIETDDQIVVRGNGFEKRLPRGNYLHEFCQTCPHPRPVLYDKLIDQTVDERGQRDEHARIREFEAKNPQERWDYFARETSRCIRCYACRNACPVCYCTECFVDCTQPQFIGTTLNESDLQLFHIVRAFHTAGRCTACGNCVRACPMDIDIGFMIGKLGKDVREFFGHEVGMNPDERPALDTHREDDPDGGFK